jgi:hypothetical protein
VGGCATASLFAGGLSAAVPDIPRSSPAPATIVHWGAFSRIATVRLARCPGRRPGIGALRRSSAGLRRGAHRRCRRGALLRPAESGARGAPAWLARVACATSRHTANQSSGTPLTATASRPHWIQAVITTAGLAGRPMLHAESGGLSLRRTDERLRTELPLWHALATVAISAKNVPTAHRAPVQRAK